MTPSSQIKSLTGQVAALTKERDALIASTGEHVTVRAEQQEKIAALTVALKYYTGPNGNEGTLEAEQALKDAFPILAQHDMEVVRDIAEIYGIDGHQWSKRPCETCETITKRFGVDWGCVAYTKAALQSQGKEGGR